MNLFLGQEEVFLYFLQPTKEGEQVMEYLDMRSGKLDEAVFQKSSLLYCRIWKEWPWNEDFWIAGEVRRDMEREFFKKNANSFFAVDGRSANVLGFSWGYSIDKDDLRAISGSAAMDCIFDENDFVFYIDELGVDAGSRGLGIGKNLSRCLIEWAIACKMKRIILRTDIKAASARKLYVELGFDEIPVADEKYPDRSYWMLPV